MEAVILTLAVLVFVFVIAYRAIRAEGRARPPPATERAAPSDDRDYWARIKALNGKYGGATQGDRAALLLTTEVRGDSGRDSWEGSFYEVEDPRELAANLRITYRTGAGSQTTRDIRLMRYGEWEGGAILWAHCRLRRANRTFRTDRVLSCIDLDTGEIIDDLHAWLDDRYEALIGDAVERADDAA
ncbi:MAG: hypothetical protein H3C26_16075 [Rhodocyclaceae bacterium]|nr:hypothetical protein [Rhodocyclaceae bacterium]